MYILTLSSPKMHAHEMHAREMHAHKMHAHKMHAHEVHACKMHVYVVHAHEMYACEVHACEIHAYEMQMTPMQIDAPQCLKHEGVLALIGGVGKGVVPRHSGNPLLTVHKDIMTPDLKSFPLTFANQT
jgi:hypothetical protein